jgi:hypothetical protein
MPMSLDVASMTAAVRAQLAHGRYPPSTLYGDGHVSGRIADALAHLTPYVQKRLYYIRDDSEVVKTGDALQPAVRYGVHNGVAVVERTR